jgi:glutamate synthase (NADPH/NADH) small chain
MLGHEVTLFDARAKAGGLNEFGIAAYKAVEGFAQEEVEWLLGIGGITVVTGRRLGGDLALGELVEGFDAVFLGIGLSGVRALGAAGTEKAGVRAAVDFIAELRQAEDLAALPVGRRVVVIGGGMTAVDAAVQSRKLGAEQVSIVYRRGRERMGASGYEQELAASAGVRIITGAVPVGVTGNGRARGVEFAYAVEGAGGLEPTGETFVVEADQVLTAIGQTLGEGSEGLALSGGKIAVDATGRTSLAGVWAGGDCASGGDDLTVTAVAEGRDAAIAIDAALRK